MLATSLLLMEPLIPSLDGTLHSDCPGKPRRPTSTGKFRTRHLTCWHLWMRAWYFPSFLSWDSILSSHGLTLPSFSDSAPPQGHPLTLHQLLGPDFSHSFLVCAADQLIACFLISSLRRGCCWISPLLPCVAPNGASVAVLPSLPFAVYLEILGTVVGHQSQPLRRLTGLPSALHTARG